MTPITTTTMTSTTSTTTTRFLSGTPCETVLFGRHLSQIIMGFSNYDIGTTWALVCKAFRKISLEFFPYDGTEFNKINYSEFANRSGLFNRKIFLDLYMRTKPQKMAKVHIFFRLFQKEELSIFKRMGCCTNLTSLSIDNAYSKFDLDLATVSQFIPQKLRSLELMSVPTNQKMISAKSLTDLSLQIVTITERLHILPNIKSLRLDSMKIPVSPEFNFIFSEGLEKLSIKNCAIEKSVFSTFPKTLKQLELLETTVVDTLEKEDTVDSLSQNRRELDDSVFTDQYEGLTSLKLMGYKHQPNIFLFKKLNFFAQDYAVYPTRKEILKAFPPNVNWYS